MSRSPRPTFVPSLRIFLALIFTLLATTGPVAAAEGAAAEAAHDDLVEIRLSDVLRVAKGGGPTVTPGFSNVTQTPGAILSGLNAPGQGRTANLVLGSNWTPEAPWSFRRVSDDVTERTEFPDLMCAGNRGCLFAPWFIDQTYWSYGDVGGLANIQKDWVMMSEWDHLGLTGVVGHPFLLGDLLIFASDQSLTASAYPATRGCPPRVISRVPAATWTAGMTVAFRGLRARGSVDRSRI